MKRFEAQATEELFEKKLITENQFEEIKAYRSLNIFSLNIELKSFLYLSVLMFTSGIGILIYQNIDTIGHIAILSILLLIIGICFFYCFKHSKDFQKTETIFENPVIEYLVLASSILTCIFIGYLQFQYNFFGEHYGLATLVSAIISFSYAYYFDNKNVLTIAITSLAAYIGISASPQNLINGDFYMNQGLSYSAVLFGGLLVLWTIYSSRIKLKMHFNFIYLTFALHIISIACISNLACYEITFRLIFAAILAVSSFYFYKISYTLKSISLYVFTLIYAYVGSYIFLYMIFEKIDFSGIWELFIILLPLFFIGSIVLFIMMIKNFHKEISK